MTEHAMELSRSGDRRTARALLQAEVRSDPTNDQAWVGLAQCAPGPGDKSSYLQLALVANPGNSAAREALSTMQSSKTWPILNIACILCGGALFFGLLGALIMPQTGNFDFAFAAGVVALFGGFGLLLFLPIRKRYTSSVDVEGETQRIRDSLDRKAAVFSHLDEWGESTCRLIHDGSIRPKMTDEMVRLAWGNPPNIDQVEVTVHYSKERWVYDDNPHRDPNYVYFRDGAVTKIIWNGTGPL